MAIPFKTVDPHYSFAWRGLNDEGFKIDYADIDIGVRNLVEQINRIDGVQTRLSCEGHNGGMPEIALYCYGIRGLKRLMTALTYNLLGERWGAGNIPRWPIANWIDDKWLVVLDGHANTCMSSEVIETRLMGRAGLTYVDCDELADRIKSWFADKCPEVSH